MHLPDHGANPARLYKQLNLKMPDSFIDFSENVNPAGPPAFIEKEWSRLRELILRYPDPDAEPFRSAAAAFHDLQPEQVAAGNGAAEIFTWLARRYRGQRVLLLEPAFSEYRKTLEAEGAEVIAVQLKEVTGWRLPVGEIAEELSGCRAMYLCNPHNPTGRLTPLKTVEQIAEACRNAGCELVVDEAFIDFAGERHSFMSLLKHFPNVIVVRSMTKMYAIPGLRLGYAAASPEIISGLRRGAAHWNVNALSAAVGARCFGEQAYREAAAALAAAERRKMALFLKESGCRVTESAANFLCFRLPKRCRAERFYVDMLTAGLVLRHTRSFAGMDGKWFRIGMKRPEQMAILRRAVAAWLQGN